MSRVDEKLNRYFTDFEGKFDAQLSNVELTSSSIDERFGTASLYLCKVKAQYNRDLLRLLDNGMLLAVRNFRTDQNQERFTLLEVVRFWPEHFGLRGVRDYQYFPMQFEVIQQSVEDWDTNDKTTMMIQLAAIPINYDLVLRTDQEAHLFERGFCHPMVGGQVYILNKQIIQEMYNQEIPKQIGYDLSGTSLDVWKNPRIGTIKMFEALGETIPIFVDFDSLVRFHFGIFAFTGGGKSNLLSNILRRLLIHMDDVKVVVFDISCEYPFLLMDILGNKLIQSQVILENKVRNAGEFYDSVVKPKKYENDEKVRLGLERIYKLGRVSNIRRSIAEPPSFADLLSDIEHMKNEHSKNPNNVEALSEVEDSVVSYMEKKTLRENDELTAEFVENLIDVAKTVATEYKIHQMSALYGWFISRNKMRRYFESVDQCGEGFTNKELLELVEADDRLICLSIGEPNIIKRLVSELTNSLLIQRKREFKVKPYILFVWDEAQEFVANPSNVSGIERACSQSVERLLRQGRKYGLGGCVSTQRIAHLNTNALQQLHTYFVSTLPRPYDRGLISNTFMVDKSILEKTLEFVPGEWLLSSYLATGMINVPIFIKAENSEIEITRYLDKIETCSTI